MENTSFSKELIIGLVAGIAIAIFVFLLNNTEVGRSIPNSEYILQLILAPFTGILMIFAIVFPMLGYLMFEPYPYIGAALVWTIILTDILYIAKKLYGLINRNTQEQNFVK